MATHLVARAREARLPVQALDPDRDYDDLESLKSFSSCAARLLLERYQQNFKNLAKFTTRLGWERHNTEASEGLNPTAALKEIQSPDYWETQRQYLESPGCLAERQKMSATIVSSETSPIPSSIKVGDHESFHKEKGHPEFTREQELVADDVSIEKEPSRRPLSRGNRSRTPLSSVSLVSPVQADGRDQPDNTKYAPGRHRRLMSKNKRATSSNIVNRTVEQALGKRESIEDAAACDEPASKRQKRCKHTR